MCQNQLDSCCSCTQCDSLTASPPAQPPDLQLIHQRIKDNIEVLQNFGTKREEGRSRQEYLSLLRQDLATYYSYSDFLIGKMMDLFPLSEVGCWEEADNSLLGLSAFPLVFAAPEDLSKRH